MHHISHKTSIVAILSLLLAACASAPGPAPIASGPVPTQIPAQIQQDLLKIGRVIAAPPTAPPGGGLTGAVMISGLFDTSTFEPNQDYFGKDASVYAQRSALPGMVASTVPMLLAYAELDPQNFHTQAEQARDAMCRTSRCPPVLKLMGHSHMSEIYSINTADVALTDALQAFVAGLR